MIIVRLFFLLDDRFSGINSVYTYVFRLFVRDRGCVFCEIVMCFSGNKLK